MVLPILLYQIGQFSVVSVLVNLLVLPVVSVAMLLTFLTGVLYLVFSPLAQLIAYPAYFSLAYIIYIVRWFAHLPGAAFIVPEFPFVLVVLCYLGIGLVIYLKVKADKDPLKEITLDTDLANWTIVEELAGEIFDKENKSTAFQRDAEPKSSKDSHQPFFSR